MPSAVVHRCLLLLSLLLPLLASAEPRTLAVHASDSVRQLGPVLETWRDGAGDTTLEEVQGLPDQVWTPSHRRHVTLGTSAAPVWVRVRIRNDSQTPMRRIVVFEQPMQARLELWKEGGGHLERARLDLPLGRRDVDRRNRLPIWELDLQAGETSTWWLRLEPPVLDFGAAVWDERAFHVAQSATDNLLMMMLGMVVAMLGLALVVSSWSSIDHARPLVLFAGGLVAFNLLSEGQWVHLGPWAGSLVRAAPAVQLLVTTALVSFARVFLESRERAPHLDPALRALQLALVGIAVLSAAAPSFSAAASSPVVWATMALLATLVARSYPVAPRDSLLFGLGLVPLAVGSLLFDGTAHGWIDGPLPSHDYVNATAPMSLLFFAVALSAKTIRTQRRQALDLKRSEEELRHYAFVDHLTGIPNRARFLQILGKRLEELSNQPRRRFALIVLDLDRFKYVNDSFGHRVGDEMLRRLAARLQATVGREDSVARFGGDEFMVLLDSTHSLETAQGEAERVLAALGQPLNLRRHPLRPSASVGLVLVDDPTVDAETWLSRADLAMYAAKDAGKGRVLLFDQTLQTQRRQRLAVEADLHRALEEGEFELHYQPVVRADSLETVGFEALLRWKHPLQGWISPADFVPVAEETGLIVQIGSWALEEAVRAVTHWNKQTNGSLFVAVNLSARQIVGQQVSGQVRRALATSGANPRWLKLELTETALVEDFELAQAELKRVHELGVGLSLDDFGTGYSSLTYLHQLPLTTIKIDRAFCSTVRRRPQSEAIVRSVLHLAEGIGLDVVAEGVETDDDRVALMRMGCDYVQGFVHSKAVPQRKVLDYIADMFDGPGAMAEVVPLRPEAMGEK